MIFLPNGVFLIIYSYVGHNSLYLDKTYYDVLIKERNQFIERPIKLRYMTAKWLFKRMHKIINIQQANRLRPSLRVLPETTLEISYAIDLGKLVSNELYSEGGNFSNKERIEPSYQLLTHVIDENHLYHTRKMYINTKAPLYSIYMMWCDDEELEHVKNYMNVWVNDS